MGPQGNGAQVIERMIAQYGCIPTIGAMTEIPTFDPLELARAIEKEINRGTEYGLGNGRITLHMHLPDAKMLMDFLRQHGRS